MSFAPPPGPPPPPVPEGWKPQYDERYKQWYFVNLHTGISQWQTPEAPAEPPRPHGAPPGPPPSYDQSPGDPATRAAAGDHKHGGSLSSNNPYHNPATSVNNIDEDARLAAQLQAEENARAAGRSPAPSSRGASDDYYNTYNQSPARVYAAGGPGPSQTPYSQAPAEQSRGKSGGFLGKLLGKASGKSSYGSPQPQYGGYPQQGYPQQGYGGYPQGGYYPQQQQQLKKKHGLGTAGAAALGLGGGLLGGMLIEDMIQDHDEHEYEEGYQDGFDDGGGDFGGDW